MSVEVLAQSAEPVPPRDPLARFSLAGLDCVVVPLSSKRAQDEGTIGRLTLAGRQYTVIGTKSPPPSPDLLNTLTPRELEVALLVAAGQETKSIARRLRISFHTVRVYVGRIYAKLGLHKQTELAARIAARYGSIPERARTSSQEQEAPGWGRASGQ